MATHHVTIAKAAFTATCLRPDATRLSREEVVKFYTLFEAAISRCSPANVQTCKNWLLDNIIPSVQKTAALGKYLVSFAKHAKIEDGQSTHTSLSGARRQLHALYILNDTLHHAKFHAKIPALEASLSEALQTHLLEVFQLIGNENKKRVSRRLEGLLDLWGQNQYFDVAIIAQMRKRIWNQNQSSDALTSITAAADSTKETPYVMPATHGDSTTPYYDLPAANLMPHIVPNKPIPMRPDQIRALQLSAGPADEGLVNAVKDFLEDVKRVDNLYHSLGDDGIVAEMDELGQLSYRNETDEVIGDTYYGWSKQFCDKMKKRSQTEASKDGRGRDQDFNGSRRSSRGSTSSRSRSFSRSPPKRRKYKGSRSRSDSPSDQRYHSRSDSRSPGDKPTQFQPSRTASTPTEQPGPGITQTGAPTFAFSSVSFGPHGLPIPPPRPPNYSGPWPPPPPPPPSGFSGMPFPPPPQFYTGSNVPPSFNHRRDKR